MRATMPEIQVVTDANITLVSRQEFYLPPHFEGWTTDAPSGAEALVEFSGRICYNSFGADMDLPGGHKAVNGRAGNHPYIKNILTVKHGSVIEHAVWSFLIEGVSRSLSHELVRHRAGISFSQLSQRYVDESSIAFVLPPEIRPGTHAFDLWLKGCDESVQKYRNLLTAMTEQIGDEGTAAKKRARQTARSVLPNCAETKLVVTGNARAWRHFVELRGSPQADVEIRRLAVGITKILKEEAPNLFMDVQIVALDDATEGVVADFSKV